MSEEVRDITPEEGAQEIREVAGEKAAQQYLSDRVLVDQIQVSFAQLSPVGRLALIRTMKQMEDQAYFQVLVEQLSDEIASAQEEEAELLTFPV